MGEAKARLSKLLRKKHGVLRRGGRLDMEPWEVLLDLLRSGQFPTVGGPPQLAKVYRYMDTRTFALRWPDASSPITLMGRQLLDDERTDAPVIDPDNPWSPQDSAA